MTLPQSWAVSSIGALADKGQYGWTTKAAQAGEVRFLRTTDITKGRIDWSSVPFCAEVPADLDKYLLEPGDIVISRAGSVGFSRLMEKIPCNTVFASYLIRFKPSSTVVPRYLAAYLNSDAYWKGIGAASVGIALANVNAKSLAALPVPLAPLAEQKRIADKLDTVLTRVDAVNTRLARVAPLLKRFRQSVLAAATSGRLTEDWRGGAMDWTSVPAAEICEKVQSGGTPKAGFAEAGVPFLKVYNIVDQRVAFDYKPQFVSQAIHESELRKSQVFPNDVLMNIVGPPLGKVAVVPADHSAWNINQAITLFRPSTKITSQWIYILLCEGAPIRDVLARTKGSVGQVNISLSQCRAFEFQVPSVEEQTEIVRRVETLFAFADRLEARLAQAQTAATRLTPALLAKAFRGELVPQDPNDEPAAELLRRLQAQRATAVSASKTGTGRGRGRTAVAAPAVTEN